MFEKYTPTLPAEGVFFQSCELVPAYKRPNALELLNCEAWMKRCKMAGGDISTTPAFAPGLVFSPFFRGFGFSSMFHPPDKTSSHLGLPCIERNISKCRDSLKKSSHPFVFGNYTTSSS